MKTLNTFIKLCIALFIFSSAGEIYAQEVASSCNRDYDVNFDGLYFNLFKTDNNTNGCLQVQRRSDNSHYLTGSWNNLGNNKNILMRKTKRTNPSINDNIRYSTNITSMNGNVYHGGYGWWNGDNGASNGIVEYYIVQGYNDKNHVIAEMTPVPGTYTIDGGTYEVYYRDLFNAPSVYGTTNFTQVKCVRTSSVAREGNRTLTTSAHINEMINRTKVNNVGNLFEVSYKIEGFGNNSSTNFAIDASFPRNNAGGGGGGNSNDNWPEISPGKYLWSSGTYNNNEGAYSANYANDNNFGTRWASNRTSSGQYYAYDLGAHYYVKKITLHFDTAYAYGVDVLIAKNGQSFGTLYSNLGIGYYSQDIAIDREVRYIAIVSRGGPYDHISLKEFDVFGQYRYAKGGNEGKVGPIAIPTLENTTDVSGLEKDLKVFPNPATDAFNINIGGMKKADITISDLLGKTIYQTTTENNIELSKGQMFKSGMYIIRATDEFNKTYTTKLIVK